jgi:membrane-associated HD superfamily phosphohydrolase
VNGPWNQLDLLLIGFNSVNFPALFTLTWQLSVALLVVGILFYNFQSRRMHAYSVFLDLNEWLMWTSVGVFLLLLMYVVFNFDFIFVLPTMIGGAALFIWIRFIHFPPMIRAYEERLARQRYFQRSKTSHPDTTIRSKAAAKPKRRRR